MAENGAGAPAKLKKGSKPEKLLAFIRLQSDDDGVLELPPAIKGWLMKRLKYTAEPNVNRDLRILAGHGLIRYEKTAQQKGRWSKATIVGSPEFTRKRLKGIERMINDLSDATPSEGALRQMVDELRRRINLAVEMM